MGNSRVKAFVLRSVPYGENRRILELLTEKGSLLTVSASLGRSGRGLGALCQDFVFAEFEIFDSRGRSRLDGGELLYSFPKLSEDWDRLAAASHLAEVFLDLLRQQEAQPAAYSLWAYALQECAEGGDPLLSARVTQFRLLAQSGFRPWLNDCMICHGEEEFYSFSLALGGLLCRRSACRHEAPPERLLAVPKGLQACLFYAAEAPYDKLFHFRLSPELREAFLLCSDAWCSRVMEKNYRRLHFSAEMESFASKLRRPARTADSERTDDAL